MSPPSPHQPWLSCPASVFQEEPKKVRFDYDLFLHLDGHPPVNHLRCEKLTFSNPTAEFRRKLLKGGGVRGKSLAHHAGRGDVGVFPPLMYRVK